ncbi:hypothetical protein [Mesoflavibacter zeaxanthinifaciens]|uniref:hypothetical protein n=1 Tax=Mesoflavibacter zeaxanthinifaciens TaxID=393060 RepID=UPI003A94C9B3
MSIEKLWNDYELFFYHEFVNSESFPKDKIEKLQQDRGHYYINNDFTIYQEKLYLNESINETDYHRNLGTFIVILYNLPLNKVKDFIEFHYNKYNGDKKKFLEFVYHELNGSKSTQSGVEIKPPQQKLITMKWCENKLEEINSNAQIKTKTNDRTYRKVKAKFIALKERVVNIQNVHSTIPCETFDSMSNQFLKEAEKLKAKFTELEDFVPSNYSEFKTHYNTYFSWASKALISDINFFIDFLDNVEPDDFEPDISEEGIFFSGQNFDALLKFNEIISKAKSEIILIDNYLDEKILEVLGSKNPNVKCKILTLKRSLNNTLKAFIDAFNKQHKNLEAKTSSVFHDRFLILDKTDFYHFGASIKDAGNKGFMFSKIEEDFIKKQLMKEIEKEWTK